MVFKLNTCKIVKLLEANKMVLGYWVQAKRREGMKRIVVGGYSSRSFLMYQLHINVWNNFQSLKIENNGNPLYDRVLMRTKESCSYFIFLSKIMCKEIDINLISQFSLLIVIV